MKDKRKEAIGLMDTNQFDSAIPLFLDLVESDPEDCSIHYMLGQCYRFNDQLPEALESLIKSEQLMNDSTPDYTIECIYLALGIAYQKTNGFIKAINTLQKGIEKNSQNWMLYNSLGLTYRIIEDFQRALSSYIKAQEIIIEKTLSPPVQKTVILEDGNEAANIDIADFHNNIAQSHLVLKSNPDYCTIMNNIGIIYFAMGDLVNAKTAFEESIHFTPEEVYFPNPKEALAEILEQYSS